MNDEKYFDDYDGDELHSEDYGEEDVREMKYGVYDKDADELIEEFATKAEAEEFAAEYIEEQARENLLENAVGLDEDEIEERMTDEWAAFRGTVSVIRLSDEDNGDENDDEDIDEDDDNEEDEE